MGPASSNRPPGRAGEPLIDGGYFEMLSTLKNRMIGLVRDEEGASLVEYVLLVALIAVVCIAAITLLGTSAKDKFSFTAGKIQNQGQ
jgi:pilus assembly protein Flp/PilA